MATIDVTCRPCSMCGEAEVMNLNEEHVAKWRSGAYAQDAFPYLLPSEREMLISGTHPECWERLFGNEFD